MAIRADNAKVVLVEDGEVKQMADLYGTSTDSKPTEGYVNGSAFLEVDTSKVYLFNEDYSSWNEVAGGGGGGGSSDFSTAEVTVVNDSGAEMNIGGVIYCAEEDMLGEGSPATLVYEIFGLAANESITLTVPLYKGLCLWEADSFGDASVSGNIIIDWAVLISGNGTITMLPAQ